MQLPQSLRESLVEEIDEYLDGFASEPNPETLVAYLIELLEVWADEEGYDDLLAELEESGSLDEPLGEAIEAEIESNDEFEFTGEELVSLLETLCEIDFAEDDEDDEIIEDDEDDDEEVEEDEEL